MSDLQTNANGILFHSICYIKYENFIIFLI